MPHSLSKRSISIALALSQEPLGQLYLVQAIFSIYIYPSTSIAVYKGVAPTRSVTSLGPISTSQQRLIHYWIRWWDRLARFTIPGMMSRILIETWQSSGCMYSCLILYCSNQCSLASSVLDLRICSATNFRQVFFPGNDSSDNPWPFSLINVVPQSPPEYEPFNFPLAQSLCLVTACSKSVGVYGLPEHPQAYYGHCWWYGQGRKRYDSWNLFVRDDWLCCCSSRRWTSLIMMTLLWNARSNNTCSLSLSLNLAALSKLMTRNWAIVASATARLCWWHSCRRWCSMRRWRQIFQNRIWRVTGVCPDRHELVLHLCVWMLIPRVFRIPYRGWSIVWCMTSNCSETKIANKVETFVTMMQGESWAVHFWPPSLIFV